MLVQVSADEIDPSPQLTLQQFWDKCYKGELIPLRLPFS